MFNNLPATLFKLLGASLAIGIVLSAFNVSAVELLGELGITQADLWAWLLKTINWVIPQLILGLLIVIPLWFIIYIFRPPK